LKKRQHPIHIQSIQAGYQKVSIGQVFHCPHAHRHHTPGMGGLDTGGGVLKYHTLLRLHAQRLGPQQKHLGVGLGTVGAVAIDHRVQQRGDAQLVQYQGRVAAG